MKKIIHCCGILFLFSSLRLSAQHQDKNWYFGTGTDGIIFNSSNNPVKVTNKHPGVGYEGMVVVSDPLTGALLFYTDGIMVIDKNHNVMTNGTGLLSNYSGSQCVQACKMPGECQKYYVISNSSFDNIPGSFYYSIVDFTTNPLGVVTFKNQYINGPNYHQAMRVIPKKNSNNYWLIGHLYNTATYHVFEVTPTGFVGPVIYNFSNWGRSWAMEYNVNTQKLLNLGEDNIKATLFDFDAATGVLSNETQLSQPPITAIRVGNFSPDGSKIYAGASPGFSLWQYDFNTSVWTDMNTCCYAHDVKTGPNGITYFINTYNATNPLSQMTNANLSAVGNACGYSTITNPGNFNGEVRRFPEFLIIPDPPVANLDTFTISAGSSITISPLLNDSDPQGDPLVLDSIISGPSLGTITVNGNQILYVSNPGICSGTDTIDYMIFDNNCSFDTALIIINIVSGSATASFNYTNNVCAGNAVTFTNTSSNATNYNWNFGDGNTSTLTNPTHVYANGGTYIITLIASSSFCTADTIQHTITIIPNVPVQANFIYNLTSCSYNVSFTNQSVNGTNYLWLFGDGNSSSQVSPAHNYLTYGNYTVILISGSACDTDSFSVNINIPQLVLPQSAFSFTIDSCTLTVNFNNQSSNSTNYQWNFGDITNSTQQNPVHIYTVPGIYNITLIASNICDSDTLQQTIDLSHSGLPQSQFSFTVPPCDLSVSFSNQSLNADNLLWNFGDGSSDTSYMPVHIYNNAGVYSVSLVAYNLCGNDTLVQTVVDTFSQGVALFTAEQQPCSSEFQFLNHSQNAFSYYWDFGDGNNDTTRNPYHKYLLPGTYSVTLFVNKGTPCSDSSTLLVTINNADTTGLWIPNCFTPNGDTKNEVFEVKGFSDCETYHLSIYNRWGQSVFETDDLKKFWDGKFKGIEVPAGVYYYLVSGKNFSRNGPITVIR